MSVLEEFETTLKELPTLKAPGVSGSRIKKLTDLAVENVTVCIYFFFLNCKWVKQVKL